MSSPKQLFDQACKLAQQGKYDDAKKQFDAIKNKYPLAHLEIADLFINRKINPPAGSTPVEAAIQEMKTVGNKNKSYYTKQRGILSKLDINSLEDDCKGDIYYFLAITYREAPEKSKEKKGKDKNDIDNKKIALDYLLKSFKFLKEDSQVELNEVIQEINRSPSELVELLNTLFLFINENSFDLFDERFHVTYSKILLCVYQNQDAHEKWKRARKFWFYGEKEKFENYTKQNLKNRLDTLLKEYMERYQQKTIDQKQFLLVFYGVLSVMLKSNGADSYNNELEFIFRMLEVDAAISEDYVKLHILLVDCWMKDDEKAPEILESYKNIFQYKIFWKEDLAEHKERMKNLIEEFDDDEARQLFLQYEREFRSDEELQTIIAEELESISTKSEYSDEELKEFIKTFRNCPEEKRGKTFKGLLDLSEKGTEYQKIIIRREEHLHLKTLGKTKDKELKDISSEIRKRYEALMKKNNPQAYFDAAKDNFEGNDFFGKNLALSRHYFKNAYFYGYKNAAYEYLNMCFNALGGNYDFEVIARFLPDFERSADDANSYYLLGDIYYFYYLDAQASEDHKNLEAYLNKAKEYFTLAAERRHKNARLSLEIIHSTWQNSTDTHHPRISLQRALSELRAGNSRPIRRILSTLSQADLIIAKDALKSFYSEKGPNGELNLISTICYLAKNSEKNQVEKEILFDILCELNDTYEGYTDEDLQESIIAREKQDGTYFDEYPSDDSDTESEIKYQNTTDMLTNKKTEIKKIENCLDQNAYKILLRKLEKAICDDEDSYRNFMKKIKSGCKRMTIYKVKPHADSVYEDVQIINQYAANGCLEEGLRLVTTEFVLAQSRGVEFKTSIWGQRQRQLYRREIYDSDHPLRDLPIYSFAVYDHAQVSDFTDISELTLLRLEKSARLVSYRLNLLRQEKPHTAAELSTITTEPRLCERKFNSRMEQVQQLYTCDKDKFEAYLKLQIERKNPAFVSDKNPFVSTGDLQSFHASRYAYGNKAYAGHKHEGLGPMYDNEGVPHRPYVGAVFLTLHPLVDYLPGNGNYIPQMNTDDDLSVDKVILPEREMSFFSSIKSGRLKYIHLAKFPYLKDGCLNAHYFKYCMEEELFTQFQHLIKNNPPHSYKHQLTVYLLGEFIGNYHSYHLIQRADTEARKSKQVLLFRDRYGNFSLRPTMEIDTKPNGGSTRKVLRRMHTHEQAEARKRKRPENSEEAIAAPVAVQIEETCPPRKRVRAAGPINWSFSQASTSSGGYASEQEDLSPMEVEGSSHEELQSHGLRR